MKTLLKLILISLVSLTSAAQATFRSPSIGGATGLITTPTAHTGWENAGLFLGAHHIFDKNDSTTPKASATLFHRWEIGGTYDIQGNQADDILVHTKLRFLPWSGSGNSALALGGNYQSLNGPDDDAGQVYLATTYGGDFFTMPAETTLVIGKSFGKYTRDTDIDFSMGFELDLLPSAFQGYVHWINDFSNYSYSAHALGAGTGRGIFNTGLRLNVLKALPNMHLNFDFLLLDAMDDNRSLALGLAFGLAF